MFNIVIIQKPIKNFFSTLRINIVIVYIIIDANFTIVKKHKAKSFVFF